MINHTYTMTLEGYFESGSRFDNEECWVKAIQMNALPHELISFQENIKFLSSEAELTAKDCIVTYRLCDNLPNYAGFTFEITVKVNHEIENSEIFEEIKGLIKSLIREQFRIKVETDQNDLILYKLK